MTVQSPAQKKEEKIGKDFCFKGTASQDFRVLIFHPIRGTLGQFGFF